MFRPTIACILISCGGLSAQHEPDPRDLFDKDKLEQMKKERSTEKPNFLGRYVSTVISTKPRRLAPGQSGTLSIIVAMRKEAVLLADQQFDLSYSPAQGSVVLGADWTISDPKPCADGTPLAGRVGYENTALVSVPIKIREDAAHGLSWLQFSLEIELMNVTNGQPIGQGKANFRGSVQVGPPLPTPIPWRESDAPEPADTPSLEAPVGPEERPPADRGTSDMQRPVLDPATTAPPESSARDDDHDESAPAPDEDFGFPYLIVVGVAALALLGLLIKRR